MYGTYCFNCNSYHVGQCRSFKELNYPTYPAPINNHYHQGLSDMQYQDIMKMLEQVLEALSNQKEVRSAESDAAK